MRGIARVFLSARTFVVALVALGLSAGCTSRASSAQHDAAPQDVAVVAQDAAGDAASDGADDAKGDGSPEAGTRVVWGLLARDIGAGVYTGVPELRDYVQKKLEDVLNSNVGDSPRGERLILLLRVEDLSDTEGRLHLGLGEEIGAPGEDLYRFRADSPPLVLPATTYRQDGGITRWYVAPLPAPVRVPFVPGGADPASEFVVQPEDGEEINWRVTFSDQGFGWLSSMSGGITLRQPLCAMWVDGMNVLDIMDDHPTAGLDGHTTGSVDFSTCACQCAVDQTWPATFNINAFWQINLVVED